MVECKDPFLKLIFDEAVHQTGKAFVPDSIEGRPMGNPPPELGDVQDWSGWLVPVDMQDAALDIVSRSRAEMHEQPFDFVWVTWSQKDDGGIAVHFEVV